MKLIGDGGGGRKVLVGVKLDPRSRELLTWALVKVAEPGDLVIALHVLDTVIGLFLSLALSTNIAFFFSSFGCVLNVVLNLECDFLCVEGTSSLLSLVKTFDSVLAVYEGFCNLKQARFASFHLLFLFFSSLFLTLLFGCEKTRENNL
jgi:hypothetical protein